MDTGKNIAGGQINPSYRAEIGRYAQKTESGGTGLFVGHKIDWWKLGNEEDLGGRIWNYCKSCVIPEYANAVRDAFWDAMKANADELAKSYQAVREDKGPKDSFIYMGKSMEKALTEIMKSRDLSKAQKMELVLRVVGEDEDAQNHVQGGSAGSIIVDEQLDPEIQAAYHQYQEAIDYFEAEKENAMNAVDKATILVMANFPSDEEKLKKIRSTQASSEDNIKTLDDLKNFQRTYAEKRIKAAVEAYDIPLGRGLLIDLEQKVANLLNENTDIILSPEEKSDLIELVQIPRVMGAIDRMAQITWKPDTAQQDAIAKDLEGLREHFTGSLNEYLTSVIDIMVKRCAGDAESLAKIEINIREFLAYEADGVQDIEKKELLELVQIPKEYAERIRNISNGLLTKELISQDTKRNIGAYADAVKNQSDDANEIIEDWIKADKASAKTQWDLPRIQGSQKIITEARRLSDNDERIVKKMTDYIRSTITNSTEEEEIMRLYFSKGPLDTYEVSWPEVQGLKDGKGNFNEALADIRQKYVNVNVVSKEEVNEHIGEFMKAMIREMMRISGGDPESVDILKTNVEKLLKDPQLNFSEKQKIKIRRELFVGSKDRKADVEGMKGLLKEITERNDISEGKRMELVLLAVGDNAEFKKIEKEASIYYFKEATEYFNSIKSIALAHSKLTLLTDTESETTTSQEHGVLYNQLSKSLTPITTFEDELLKAASKKHTTFYNEIASNKDLQKSLASITDDYNNKTIKSESEFIKTRMDYNKVIIKTVIAAWPSLNITSTRILPDRIGGTLEERTLKTESLPLDDMKSALNDNIKKLGETSHPPLSQVEIDELKKIVETEFASTTGTNL